MSIEAHIYTFNNGVVFLIQNVSILTPNITNINKKIVKWRPPSLSELSQIIFYMELTHLGLHILYQF